MPQYTIDFFFLIIYRSNDRFQLFKNKHVTVLQRDAFIQEYPEIVICQKLMNFCQITDRRS